MKKIRLITNIAAVLLLAGCTSLTGPSFRAVTGPDTVHKGSGGKKTEVGGIDIWESGTPPRIFVFVGVITDDRIGTVPPEQLFAELAAIAKAQKADAVLMTENKKNVFSVVRYQ